VLSRFTAYVAVDRSTVVNEGGEGRQIVQPVETPAGWAETEIAFSCLMAAPAAPRLGAGLGRGGQAREAPPPAACAPPPSPVDAENLESVDSMLQEFTDTAIDFTETESVDSMLSSPPGSADSDIVCLEGSDDTFADSDCDEEESDRPPVRSPGKRRKAEEGKPGWFRRLLNRLRGKQAPTPAVTLDDCRRQGNELLREMGNLAGTTGPSRRAALLGLFNRLHQLLLDIDSLGASAPAGTEVLARAVRDLDKLRQSGGDNGKVEKVWQALEGALRAFAGGDADTSRREAFWK
jgi:hypothetical protein